MSNNDNEIYFAYATHLRDEHRQLQACLQRVEKLWQQRRLRHGSKLSSEERLIAAFVDLRAQLARHLAEEEAGGCVEEAVLHTPQLTHAAMELEREDPKLLARLDELIIRLRTATRMTRKIENDYRQLMKQICEHTAAETQIVEESFGLEVD